MWTVVVSGSPEAVPTDGGAGSASVSNTRKLGGLEVTKTVNWNGVTPVGQIFDICITGPSYPAPGSNCKEADHDGEVLTWTGLIPGDYTVTETPGTMWTVVVSDLPAVVPPDGSTVYASVSNTRKLGSLEVTKTVNWNGVTPVEEQTFDICISGPSYPAPGSNCKEADNDGSLLTWTGLIPGDYTVTETDPGTMWTVVVSGSPAAVPPNGGMVSASVSNRWFFADVVGSDPR
jgi:predicted methyltransferase